MEDRIKGIVKWFNDKKGYGYITQENGTDIFVHYSSVLTPGFCSLSPGQLVTFFIVTTPKGLSARRVIVSEPDDNNWSDFIGDSTPIKD